jgi:hypothetical protein
VGNDPDAEKRILSSGPTKPQQHKAEGDLFARYPSLADKVVLITGGASGIGAAMVELFARQGSRVALLDIDDPSALKLVECLRSQVKHTPKFLKCDLKSVGGRGWAGSLPRKRLRLE